MSRILPLALLFPALALAEGPPPGTYDHVNSGGTFMQTNTSLLNLSPGQTGYSPGINSNPVPYTGPSPFSSFTPSPSVQGSSGSPSGNGKSSGNGQPAGNGQSASGGSRNPLESTPEQTGFTQETGGNTGGTATTNTGASTNQFVPVTLESNGTTVNATEQTTTTSGVTTPITNTVTNTVTYAPYNPNLIAIGISSPSGVVTPYFGATGNVALLSSADITYTSGLPSGINLCSNCAPISGGFSSAIHLVGAANPVTGSAAGMNFGRWTTSTGFVSSYSTPIGNQYNPATPWIYGPQGYIDPVAGVPVSLSGTFSYQLDGSTAPIDRSTGNGGTLTSASLSADFTHLTVNASIGLSMNGVAWSANATGMSISNAQFSAMPGSGLTINQGGSPCSGCGGQLSGAFTGQNYAGALLSYNLFDTGGTNLYGAAALTRNYAGNTNPAVTNGAPTPTGNYFVAYSGNGIQISSSAGNSGNVLTSFGSSSVSSGSYSISYSTSVSCTSCTGSASGDVANTGIYYGTWNSGTITSSFNTNWSTSPGQFHWITGPEVYPVYLAQVLTGTATFPLAGGTSPTDQNGNTGTLNSGSLFVNFDQQKVGISLSLSVNSHNWSVTTPAGNEMPLQGSNGVGNTSFAGFGALSGSVGPGNLSVTMDGSAASGNLSGQLSGTGITGAMVDYNLSGNSASLYQSVNGVAAFSSTPFSTTTPYQLVAISSTDLLSTSTSTSTYTSTYTSSGLGAAINALSRISSSAGNLTGFDISPVDGGSSASFSLSQGSSTATDMGSDPVSGISWGRWQGGVISYTDRSSGAAGTITLAGGLHWVSGPVETGPVTLPTSGTYTYIFAGGTHPTDNLGNVGVLNSATLSADFTAQTVGVGINATVAGSTLNAQASGVPINQGMTFKASTSIPSGTAGNLSVSCSGSCGASTSGTIAGAFTGAGATGAGVTYMLQRLGGISPGSISGVAAFHR